MTILQLGKVDKQTLKSYGLKVTKNSVSGKLKEWSSDRVVKAYEQSLEYPNKFTFYVGNHPELKDRLVDNNSDLLEKDLVVVGLYTYSVYTGALRCFHGLHKPVSILLTTWELVEVHYRLNDDSKPHLEPRFHYTPKEKVYQVKFEDRNYRVEISDNTSESSDIYQIRVADLPLMFGNKHPLVEDVLEYMTRHKKEYYGNQNN